MPQLTIKNIAVIAQGGSPIGEASITNPDGTPMTAEFRKQMVDRLFDGINKLMTKASSSHEKNNEEKDPNYITRLSTHEFFFYTQEPLTLKEFELLQQRISEIAKTLNPGIQMVLGSFAVKTEENQVMNVTPHITCGNPPSFHFIVKNYTSGIDVCYDDLNDASGKKLTPLNKERKPSNFSDITVDVNGTTIPFTFYNLLSCKTPGGLAFLTAVDICLDYGNQVAKSHVETLKENENSGEQFISHVLISNYIESRPNLSLGPITHIDPVYSKHQFNKQNIVQSLTEAEPGAIFGPNATEIYELMPSKCFMIKEAIARLEDVKRLTDEIQEKLDTLNPTYFNRLYNEVEAKFYTATLFEDLQNSLTKLEQLTLMTTNVNHLEDKFNRLRFNTSDKQMDFFLLEEIAPALQKASTIEEAQKIIKTLEATAEALANNKAIEYIRNVISHFRNTLGVGVTSKASRIEKAMGEMPIEERKKFPELNSSASKKVKEELASRRSFFSSLNGKIYKNKQGDIDSLKAGETYTNFEKQFSNIKKTTEFRNKITQINDEMNPNKEQINNLKVK